MKDKNIIALLTIIFFILYFSPFIIIKIISVFFILFFAPGFFTLRIYKEIKREELLLIAPPLSLAISGLVALILAAFSILKYDIMLVSIGVYIFAVYILSSGKEVEKVKIKKPAKFATLVIILSLILISIWGYTEFSTPSYNEVDISIEEWPHNVTIGTNLTFEIYVKNWNYENGKFSIIFKLNNQTISIKKITLSPGEGVYLLFHCNSSKEGINLASFDLYLDGKFYTNVHVYFNVKLSK